MENACVLCREKEQGRLSCKSKDLKFLSLIQEGKDTYKEILFNYEIDWEDEAYERLILNADEIIKSPDTENQTLLWPEKGYQDHFRDRICRAFYPGKENMHHRQQW
jgi:hypothetical protein